jgi:hypothetical protein
MVEFPFSLDYASFFHGNEEYVFLLPLFHKVLYCAVNQCGGSCFLLPRFSYGIRIFC